MNFWNCSQVWLEISDCLDHSSHLNLRATCHRFLNLIDSYIGTRVTFSAASVSDPEIFSFFCNVGLYDVQFEEAEDESQFTFSSIFAYPNYLTDVSFTGKTNLKLIQDIMMNCSCLQLVEMNMDCQITTQDLLQKRTLSVLPEIDILAAMPPTTCHLNCVECLKLVPGYQNDDNLRSHVVLSILRATKAPLHLRKVIFQCELSEQVTLKHVLNITAELMERHPKLEALFIAFLNDEYLLSEQETQNFSHYMDLKESANSEELEYFKSRIVSTGRVLKIKKMGLAMLNMNMQLIWRDFLKTQYHIVHLSLTVTITEDTFSQDLFEPFSETLEQLAVRGKFEVPFNFMHVSNCRNLKEICLHNLQENGGGGIVPKCINLAHVPEGLESLILFQVVVRTEELQQTVLILENLTTLVVFKCGHAAGETGVGLECLTQILHKRTLQSILLVQFICGSTTEAEALAGVLYRMAQDSENQASQLARRRRPLQENDLAELDLDEIAGNDDEVFMFPLGQHEEIPERPVSRGNHRIPVDDILGVAHEDTIEHEEFPQTPENVDADETSEDLTLPAYPTQTCGITDCNDNYPPSTECINTFDAEDFPPLPEIESAEGIEPPRSNNNNINNEEAEEIREPEMHGALNMLQDILEHALVPNPAQRDGQNYQGQFPNRVNLNQFHEIDEDVELILDVGDEPIGPVLDLFAAERLAREHNVQVGFILDGVIDIMNEEVVRSKWLCVEDKDGHITYTLKISVEL